MKVIPKSNTHNPSSMDCRVTLINRREVLLSTLCCPICGSSTEVINYQVDGAMSDHNQLITRCSRQSNGRILTDEDCFVTTYVSGVLELECPSNCLNMIMNIDEVVGKNVYSERY